MTRQFYTVDVFAQRKYTGNQLAVVTEAAGLSTETMQAIAAEFGYSETTFVTGEGDPWPVRIFTPNAEIPFAGHPTLGTAAVIREHLAADAPAEVTLDLAVGEIPVDVRQTAGEEVLWMRQREPTFGQTFDHDRLATVLGCQPAQLDTEFPVQVVSTGLDTIIVPLTSQEALTGIDLDRDAYNDLVTAADAELVHAVCPEPREASNDLAVRMFAPALGVFEDPATGSANGCLAAYLSKHEYFDSPVVDARVEQGYELGRPSLLHLAAEPTETGIAVEVGGRVIPVSRGELL